MSTSDVVLGPQGAAGAAGGALPSSRRIWWTRRAVGLHVTLVLVLPTFVALFWWQVDRVRQGNTLSWAYVFEWPFFTGYALYMWWKLVHDPTETAPAPTAGVRSAGNGSGQHDAPGAGAESGAETGADADGPGSAEGDEDEDLAAYNRYLAELHASGRPKRW